MILTKNKPIGADSAYVFFEIECLLLVGTVTKQSGHQLLDYICLYNLMNLRNWRVREYAIHTRLCTLFPSLKQFDKPPQFSEKFEYFLLMYVELVIYRLTDERMPIPELFRKARPEWESDEDSDATN